MSCALDVSFRFFQFIVKHEASTISSPKTAAHATPQVCHVVVSSTHFLVPSSSYLFGLLSLRRPLSPHLVALVALTVSLQLFPSSVPLLSSPHSNSHHRRPAAAFNLDHCAACFNVVLDFTGHVSST